MAFFHKTARESTVTHTLYDSKLSYFHIQPYILTPTLRKKLGHTAMKTVQCTYR